MMDICSELEIPSNVWLGVTVERKDYLDRISDLREVACSIRFVSMEPLLEPLDDLDLHDIHWVIVGGESGPKARSIEEFWILDIKEQCEQQNAAFFFKQWGGVNKKRKGRMLLGQTWNGMPSSARVG